MGQLAILGVVIVFMFIAFVIFWNRQWRGKILDEREANLRLRVRVMISKAIEIALITAFGFHLLVRPLSGVEALVTVGLTGVLAEAFSNWYLRREDSNPTE